MDQEILSVLQSIKLALYCLVVASTASVLLGLLRVWIARRREIRAALDQVFADRATKYLAEGKLTEAVQLCTEQIEKRPGDTYALWYLGMGQFRLSEYEAAKLTFSKLVQLEPGWEESHVKPVLAKMAASHSAF